MCARTHRENKKEKHLNEKEKNYIERSRELNTA